MSEPNNAVATTQPKRSLVATLAAQYDMEPQPFLDAISQTVMPTDRQTNNAMIAAFLLVCNEHGLNPFTREIFAFPSKTGGIQPIVSIDGWVKLVNRHPQFAGMDLKMDLDEKGKPISCTCTIYRKDRDHATPITEYYDECYRNTDPWNKMPKRMMRHKALKEAARYTFGFAGIMDEDEGNDVINVTAMSTEMERSTLTKAEALKEKINVKKEAKASEKPKEEPKTPEPIPIPAPAPAPAPEPVQPPVDDIPPLAGGEPFEPDNVPAAAPENNRPITEDERKAFLGLLQGKTTPENKEKALKDTRKRLFDLGYTNTKEILVKDLPQLMAWAKEVKF